MIISMLGFGQNVQEDIKPYLHKRYDIRFLASDSTKNFLLVNMTKRVSIDAHTHVKSEIYSMLFIRLDDGTDFYLTNESSDVLIAALKGETHYIYYDGDALYVMDKTKEKSKRKKRKRG